MKKRLQRCKVLRRFSALVAALMMCAALCMPCFASNNASTKKWYVSQEAQMTNESGTMSRFLRLTPYVDGSVYASQVITSGSSVSKIINGKTYKDVWVVPINYPDWWRASIPLGGASYIEISQFQGQSLIIDGVSQSFTSAYLYLLNRQYAITFTGSPYSSGASFSAAFDGYPLQFYRYRGDSVVDLQSPFYRYIRASSTSVSRIDTMMQLVPSVLSATDQIGSDTSTMDFVAQYTFRNLSSDDLILCVTPPTSYLSDYSTWFITCSFSVSFWVDANKLPAGLQVGDEFPADTDAFDQLRDELLDQFPEASENIQNGKSTLTGWNDTQTVGEDVASSASSVLAAIFQNLGTFLFTVSLMIFGAVVLRMFIKKAVS